MNTRIATVDETQRAVPTWRHYVALTKPRLSSFALVVVFLSGWMAAGGGANAAQHWVVWHAVLAAGLLAGGANALNMFMERDFDKLMRRTANRPIQRGLLTPREVLVFGVTCTVVGVLWLALATTPLAAMLGALTSVLYLGVYTPLKRRTTLNTHVGAIPGALPALIGWAAVAGRLDAPAWGLFWIVFFWQIPHFLAIAWMYRDDYAAGGYRMLPAVDRSGVISGRQAVLGALALLAVSILPALRHERGVFYIVGAVGLGAYFIYYALRFARQRDGVRARALMRASLLYLPLLLGLIAITQR